MVADHIGSEPNAEGDGTNHQADDLDREETGSYSSPAFSTLKKAASVAKPPELHVSDYMGKDDPMVGQIKTADRAASKASKVAAKTSKMRRT